MGFDPEYTKQRIAELDADPGVTAHVDQRQAALKEALGIITWWGSLMVVSQDRGEEIAYAAAMFGLRGYLNEQPEDMLSQLVVFLTADTVLRLAKYEYGGDVNAAVMSIVGPTNMDHFDKFVATSGQSCSYCGGEDGWEDHECETVDEADEPQQS